MTGGWQLKKRGRWGRAFGAVRAAGWTTVCFLGLSCSPYQQQLQRGLRYYENNQYEEALALWRDLGAEEKSFSRSDQARYAYLRGMTDYRLGFAGEARYWLSLARATDQLHPGGFEPQWSQRLTRALRELSRITYAGVAAGAQDSVQAIEAAAPEPVPAAEQQP